MKSKACDCVAHSTPQLSNYIATTGRGNQRQIVPRQDVNVSDCAGLKIGLSIFTVFILAACSSRGRTCRLIGKPYGHVQGRRSLPTPGDPLVSIESRARRADPDRPSWVSSNEHLVTQATPRQSALWSGLDDGAPVFNPKNVPAYGVVTWPYPRSKGGPAPEGLPIAPF
jgi:hypothetical protein